MDGAMRVHQVPAGSDNLVWVIECVASKTAGLVDGPDAEGALALCATLGLTPTVVLNTHTHADHVGINRDLAGRGILHQLTVYGPSRAAAGVPGLTHPVDEGDEVVVGGCHGQVMLTEGHINGHISYLFGDVLFCGDTLFTGGCGYLFDGPPEKMFDSLMRLASLPGGTRVCCAHEYTKDNLRFAEMVEPGNPVLQQRIRDTQAVLGAGGCAVPSTIELERATNPFLRPGSPELMANVQRWMPDHTMSTPSEVFTATRALKDTGQHRE